MIHPRLTDKSKLTYLNARRCSCIRLITTTWEVRHRCGSTKVESSGLSLKKTTSSDAVQHPPRHPPHPPHHPGHPRYLPVAHRCLHHELVKVEWRVTSDSAKICLFELYDYDCRWCGCRQESFLNAVCLCYEWVSSIIVDTLYSLRL